VNATAETDVTLHIPGTEDLEVRHADDPILPGVDPRRLVVAARLLATGTGRPEIGRLHVTGKIHATSSPTVLVVSDTALKPGIMFFPEQSLQGIGWCHSGHCRVIKLVFPQLAIPDVESQLQSIS